VREANALELEVQTEPVDLAAAQAHSVHFNRAVVSSQAYARNFGLAAPSSDPRILKWLARGLDDAILSFIQEAAAPGTSLRVAAYHLNNAPVYEALGQLGNRVEVVLDKEENSNLNAINHFALTQTPYHIREHVPNISHNKFIVLLRQGQPEAVLMGSTNFTTSGISEQNNVCHIIRNPAVAARYSRYWELLRDDQNAPIREFNKTWKTPDAGLGIEVNFSPHSAGQRVDLDRYVDLAQAAQSSLIFAMFMGTDAALIRSLVQPQNNLVVRGLVNDVTQASNASEGQVIMYHEAHEANPAVTVARPLPREIEPFLPERERQWTGNYFIPLVHHKFMVLGFPGPNAVVVTGSANYSKNSTEQNDENTIIIPNDPRIVDLYVGELFRIYEHYRSRWFLSRSTATPSELALKTDGSWINKYYAANNESARFLQLLLSAAP
jgi:phosphatidylserine/phosphatidylglycerophosphate/cardiolipin synthase-like enzyme